MGEIAGDFLVFDPAGLYCRYGDFYLDPEQPVSHAVISHAHGDHARADHLTVYGTAPTLSFMEHRFGKRAYKSARTIPFYESVYIGDVKITFYPAGHILGSALILMEHNSISYLYTGDYKCQQDPTCEPFGPVKADVLITESTFADPAVRHPDPVQEIQKLATIESNILLGTYSLGKAQRLTHLINRHCPEKTIWVHHSILPYHRIYQRYLDLDLEYFPYNRKALKLNPRHQVYMVPPTTFRYYIRAKNVVRVFASGWKRLQAQNDASLFISDHVDWQDILNTIQSVAPREVWTLHGDGRALEAHFRLNPIRVKRLN